MKKIFKKIKDNYAGFKWYNWIIYLIIIALLLLVSLVFPIITLIFIVIVVLYGLFQISNTFKFLNSVNANGIIGGNRGSGKGVLLQIIAKSEKSYFSNVPMGYGYNHLIPLEYFQSIGDNTIIDAINGTIKIVKKVEKFEGIKVLFDDTTVYLPNFMDHDLKRTYPSLPLVLAVNRHLYNAPMIISSQTFHRPYKIARELQTDFFVKALKTRGWGWFWSSIPILRKWVKVKYRYYDTEEAALANVLPFKAIGGFNEMTKQVYLTAGQSTKEVFEATNGIIYESNAWIKKKNVKYDTRHFHKVFYGVKAPKKP